MKETIDIALLGLGTVGTGVYKILQMQKEEMAAGSEEFIMRIFSSVIRTAV